MAHPHFFAKKTKLKENKSFSFNLSLFLSELSILLNPLGWNIEKITKEKYQEKKGRLKLSPAQWVNLINHKKIPLVYEITDITSVEHDVVAHLIPIYMRLKSGDTALFDTMNYIIENQARKSFEEQIIDFGLFEFFSLSRKVINEIKFNNQKDMMEVICALTDDFYKSPGEKRWKPYLKRYLKIVNLFQYHINKKEFSLSLKKRKKPKVS